MYGVGGGKQVCVRTLWPSRGRVRVDSKPLDGRNVIVIRGRQTRAVRWGSEVNLILLICHVRDLCVETFQHRRGSIASFVDRLEVRCYDFLEIRDLVLLSPRMISGLLLAPR